MLKSGAAKAAPAVAVPTPLLDTLCCKFLCVVG